MVSYVLVNTAEPLCSLSGLNLIQAIKDFVLIGAAGPVS